MSSGCVVRSSLVVAVATTLLTDSFHPRGRDSSRIGPPQEAALAELWVDPGDISRRDAVHGPGGRDGAPPVGGVFEVKAVDTTGYSRGYTVSDAQGRMWNVKVGPEAQPEVVASRVLWLIGYHQPSVYFVADWRHAGDGRPQLSARFRLQSDHRSEGEWSWTDNPFAGTRAMRGLVVVNLLLNNWDFKTSNNRVYTIENSGVRSRWFVVQDLGASLGGTAWPIGSRNDIDRFEMQRFVSWDNGRLRFDYRGRHRELLDDITAEDVVWACAMLDRISDEQWIGIFTAAAYPDSVVDRYRAHLAAKIAEGLALAPASQVKP